MVLAVVTALLAPAAASADLARPSDRDVTPIPIVQRFLSIAADCNIDLMVMGGYGHSRLQERILGGVTRGMFNSMTVPTLMSH